MASLTVMLLAVVLQASTAPATGPRASAPASKPALTEMIDAGRVRYAPPPAPWLLIEKSPKDRVAVYQTEDGVGQMTVTVTPQPDAVKPEHAKKMALKIGEGIRAYAKQSGVELLYGPRVEKDDRFMLTVRDRMRVEGTAHDRLQMYRMIDSLMLSVAVTAKTDSEEEAKAIHAAGQALLDTAKAGRGPTLSAFPRTGIRVFPPAEWVEKKVDDANGIVATYAEPNSGPARIEVRSRVVPKKIRGHVGVAQREAMIDEMMAASGLPPASAERVTIDENNLDEKPNFVRAVRLAAGEKRTLHAEARYVMLGDTMIGVTIRGPTDRADELAGLVDRMTAAMQRIPGR